VTPSCGRSSSVGRSPRALLNAISGGVLEIGLDAD
jgi:hypothetical protein